MVADLAKPLWIPLSREWFIAFETRQKRHEWRRYDARWNERSCVIGRRVTLSLGYSGRQLYGVVVSFRCRVASGPAVAIYGTGTLCAVIGINLD